MDKDELGRAGEDAAAAYLMRQGMRILARNWRCDRGELDIVAGDGDCLVVCEVKTRRTATHGTPLEAVGTRKMRQLRLLAGRWLTEHAVHAPRVRIDVIGIVVPGSGPARIEHVRGAE